jgi:nucleoside-diphosphate-sugar epimerase
LIIALPPGRRAVDGAENYRLMADYFLRELQHCRVRKIIFVSSTAVYNDTNTTVSETDLPLPESAAGKLLLEIENQFLSIKSKQVIIVRSCGLVGPERHPSRFFRNKTTIPNGLAPINLIHLDDVIGIIINLIIDNKARGIYNSCSLHHPDKQDFYGLAAKFAGFEAPKFISERESWKIISSVRVEEELNYQFKYPDLLEWLKKVKDG